ncbi:hypothetical protein WMY93_006136 [Mugilogobius chulae]|uniref:L1 transposable element RRM domain-containing protein n=1 Tax=Mugilogobius chulae TaxID=88201 RepID=A0AAW0PVA6_9GOBI
MPKPPESKRTRDLLSSSDPEDNVAFTNKDREMLCNINKQLQKLDVLDELKADVAELKNSVDFANSTMEELKEEHKTLKEDVATLKQTVTALTKEKGETYNTSEALFRSFLQEHLGLREDEVKVIRVERAHRLGQRKSTGNPRPIVVKFTSSKQADYVLSLSKALKGTSFYMTKQYPAEVVARRRELVPIMNSLRQKGQKVRMVVDKLYVDGELYRHNSSNTPKS